MSSELQPVLMRGFLCLGAAVLCTGTLAQAGEAEDVSVLPGRYDPNAVFVQAGVNRSANSLTLGALWDTRWRLPLSWGRLGGYWEASVGRWSSPRDTGQPASAWVSQFGLTPVLRLQPQGWAPGLFVEGGIGVHVLTPIYRNRGKRFSTAFNFGDHLGLGYQWGEGGRHELVLRIQHFSNAGIKQPNPGEDFLQLRYSQRL